MIREKRIQRIYRLCTALLAIIQTAIVLAEAIIQNEGERYFSPYLGILWNTVNIFFLVSLLIAYMYINIGLLVAMHRRHRLEFKEHIWWQAACIAGTFLVTFNLISVDTIWLLVDACLVKKNSQCRKVRVFFKDPDFGTRSLNGIFFSDCSQLIAIWAFLIFNRPHDCFECLGKDPQRNYSMFQYGKREQMLKKMKAKHGSVKVSNLTDEDLLSRSVTIRME